MKMSRTLLSTAGLMTLVACAQSTYRADIGAMFSKHDGRIALQNSSGSNVLGDEMNSLEKDLGIGDTEASPYVRLQWDEEVHRVRMHGFGLHAGGSGVLNGDFGNLSSGSTVSTSMEYWNVSTAYSYALVQNYDFRLGVGAQLGFYALDVAARSGGIREEVETSVLVPMPYVDGEFYLGDLVTLGANAGYMSADLGDGDGRYWDADVWGRVRVTDEIELLAGYRYLLMDADGRASSRDFDADLDVQGWWVGGGVRF